MPSPEFTIREIARQAGVSAATVDRVLHDRGGVRASTTAAVRRAIVDLERNRQAFELGGRSFTIDLVVQSPRRFSSALWRAFETAVPLARPAEVRVRPQAHERRTVDQLVASLDRIAHRGSHGVVLKAPDTAEIRTAVDGLQQAGIPVVTIVTDVPNSNRVAYVGIDNRSAGATAAYLIDQWLPRIDRPACVLQTMSSLRFQGEEQRLVGFRRASDELDRVWEIVDLVETEGLDTTIGEQLRNLDPSIRIDAVYSMGGANSAIVESLARRPPAVFIAHDLDEDNRRLLGERTISAVLHHDLTSDAVRCIRLIMQWHGTLPGKPTTMPAAVQIVTPHNLPSRT